jgi:hypothetical protein
MNEQRNSNVECGLTKGATTLSTSSKRSNLSNILDRGEARSNSVNQREARSNSVDQREARSSSIDQGLLITNQSS